MSKEEIEKCYQCMGTGKVSYEEKRILSDSIYSYKECYMCNGKGFKTITKN